MSSLQLRIAAAVCAVAALSVNPSAASAAAIRSLADLQTVTVYERTGGDGPNAYIFAPNSAAMTQRLATLDAANRDFFGTSIEHYDVFYSNADGSFNIDGAYITVEALYSSETDSGLNLSEIELNFSSSNDFGDFVASFVLGVTHAFVSAVGSGADGDLLTHTAMGTQTDNANRMRVTVGFNGISNAEPPTPGQVPEPASALLLLAAAPLLARRRR